MIEPKIVHSDTCIIRNNIVIRNSRLKNQSFRGAVWIPDV